MEEGLEGRSVGERDLRTVVQSVAVLCVFLQIEIRSFSSTSCLLLY